MSEEYGEKSAGGHDGGVPFAPLLIPDSSLPADAEVSHDRDDQG